MFFVSLTDAHDVGRAAAAGAVEVDLDLTVVGQMVLFVVLMLVLKPVLFDPMLKLFEEREKRIDGAKLAARKMDQESAEALDKYESAMKKVRAEANAEREVLRSEGVRAENEILAKVRASVGQTLEQGRSVIQTEVDKARTALRADGGSIARDVASRALGREVH